MILCLLECTLEIQYFLSTTLENGWGPWPRFGPSGILTWSFESSGELRIYFCGYNTTIQCPKVLVATVVTVAVSILVSGWSSSLWFSGFSVSISLRWLILYPFPHHIGGLLKNSLLIPVLFMLTRVDFYILQSRTWINMR